MVMPHNEGDISLLRVLGQNLGSLYRVLLDDLVFFRRKFSGLEQD